MHLSTLCLWERPFIPRIFGLSFFCRLALWLMWNQDQIVLVSSICTCSYCLLTLPLLMESVIFVHIYLLCKNLRNWTKYKITLYRAHWVTWNLHKSSCDQRRRRRRSISTDSHQSKGSSIVMTPEKDSKTFGIPRVTALIASPSSDVQWSCPSPPPACRHLGESCGPSQSNGQTSVIQS